MHSLYKWYKLGAKAEPPPLLRSNFNSLWGKKNAVTLTSGEPVAWRVSKEVADPTNALGEVANALLLDL